MKKLIQKSGQVARRGLLGIAASVLVLSATSPAAALIGQGVQIGVFRDGAWFLDANGDNAWSGSDIVGSFGQAGDKPVTSTRCNPESASTEIFVTRGTFQWFGSTNGYTYDDEDDSYVFGYQTSPMRPVMLEGRFAAVDDGGIWIWDSNGDRKFSELDVGGNFGFGTYGDIPVAGRWGSGATESPGTFRNGLWILDSNNNRGMDGGDVQFWFGMTGDLPVVGDFNVNKPGDEVAVFRNGTWFVDFNGNRIWNDVAGGDKVFSFGQAGDIPVLAKPSWTANHCIH